MDQKRKRSAAFKLTTMLAGAASFTLTGCGDAPGQTAQWDRPQPQVDRGEQVQALAYANLDACKAANEVPDEQCETSWAAAQRDDQASAPRYAERASCEDVYGVGNCVPRGSGGSGSFFTPLLAGFVIGQMMDSLGRPYYRGTGLYREDYAGAGGGGYRTGWGGTLGRDYNTGRATIARQGIEPPDALRQAPAKVQTRTSVVSRGGFGGGRGFGHGG